MRLCIMTVLFHFLFFSDYKVYFKVITYRCPFFRIFNLINFLFGSIICLEEDIKQILNKKYLKRD